MKLYIVIIFLFLLISCEPSQKNMVNKLLELDGIPLNAQDMTEKEKEKVKNITKDIKKYSDIVQQKLIAWGDLSNAYKMLAVSYMQMEMYGLSLQNYENALKISMGSPKLFFNAATVAGYYALSQPTQEEEDVLMSRAIRYYEQAITLNPNYSNAMYGLAIIYIQREEFDNAKKQLYRAIGIDGNFSRALLLLGKLYAKDENTQQALIYVSRAIESAKTAQEKEIAMQNRQDILQGSEL